MSKSILTNCLNKYVHVLHVLENTPQEKVEALIRANNMQYGICRFIKAKFKKPYDWVEDILLEGNVPLHDKYIAPTPASRFFKKEATIASIQERIKALEKIINQ